jgi:hypothetical protein
MHTHYFTASFSRIPQSAARPWKKNDKIIFFELMKIKPKI